MFSTSAPIDTTLLNPEDSDALKISSVTTRAELNDVEQRNIDKAFAWLEKRRKAPILEEDFIVQLHKKMFGDVWKWAGKIRQRDTNIGVHWTFIRQELRSLIDDVKQQIASQAYPPDDIALRFHHRLVWIHVFPNGNGRHARLMTDILLTDILNRPVFDWGRHNLVTQNNERVDYIQALKAADGHDYSLLEKFVRS